jgi:putative peptide zinc metalloprotease protein
MPTYLSIQNGCEFYPYGAGRYVLHTPNNRHFLVSDTTKELLEALSIRTPLETICENLGDSATTAEELKSVLEKRYSGLGVFLSDEPKPISETRSLTAGLAFLKCWDLVPASLVRHWAAGLRWLYGTAPAAITLAAIAAAHIALYSQHFDTFHLRLPHGSPLIILFLSLFSILAHEMGHATALARYGAAPGKIGFGLYLLMPTFFADVSEVWRLPRKGRLVVDLGGVYFQQAVFIVFAILALQFSSLELAAPCYAIDTMTLVALNPVFRFDGYWLLADWLELPKLHSDAVRLLKQWGSRIPKTRPQLGRVQSAVFMAYAASCILFLAISLLLSVHYLRSGLFGFVERLPGLILEIRLSARAGDWATTTDQVVSTVVASAFSGTAIFGLSLYAGRLLAPISRLLRIRVGTQL